VKLTRLIDPARQQAETRVRVHYAAPDGQTLMCGLGRVYRELDGERFPVWHPTKRPVTCASCTKRLEALTRFQLNGLDSEQLEAILAHIESFRVPQQESPSTEQAGGQD
jgi:hypothetical protein